MIVPVPHLDSTRAVYMHWEPNTPKALAILSPYAELSNSTIMMGRRAVMGSRVGRQRKRVGQEKEWDQFGNNKPLHWPEII